MTNYTDLELIPPLSFAQLHKFKHKKLYLVIEDPVNEYHPLVQQTYSLAKGDIIRLGKFRAQLRAILSDNEKASQEFEEIKSRALISYLRKKSEKQVQDLEIKAEEIKHNLERFRNYEEIKLANDQVLEKKCRICFSANLNINNLNNNEFNPLISVCKCKGYSEYIHLCCLRQEIKSRVEIIKINQAIIIPKEKYKCSVCKEIYPEALIFKKKANKTQDIQFLI